MEHDPYRCIFDGCKKRLHPGDYPQDDAWAKAKRGWMIVGPREIVCPDHGRELARFAELADRHAHYQRQDESFSDFKSRVVAALTPPAETLATSVPSAADSQEP